MAKSAPTPPAPADARTARLAELNATIRRAEGGDRAALADIQERLRGPGVADILNGNPARQALMKEVQAHPGGATLTKTLLDRQKDEKTWFGIATPAEMGRLLEGIEKGTLAGPSSIEEMRKKGEAL